MVLREGSEGVEVTEVAVSPTGCWSWRHREIAPLVEQGRLTCAEHRDEEAGIRVVLKQLSYFARQVAHGLAGPPRLHLSRYEDVVEENLKGFFQKGLDDYEVRRGNYQSVENEDRQRDVVVVERIAVDPDLWSAELTLPDEFSKSALAVFEVAHAAATRTWDGMKGLAAKLRTDLDRIATVIDEGVRQRRKIYTGLALIGAGWAQHIDAIAALLHDHHHARDVSRVQVGDDDQRRFWWPFVDVVIAPGCLFKKHDFFERKTVSSCRWPVLYQWWTGLADDQALLRPLSIARGYVHHFLTRARYTLDEEPAFDHDAVAAICGPAPEPTALPDSSSWHGKRIGVMVGDGTPESLHHSCDRTGHRWRPVLFERNERCSAGGSFIAVTPAIDASGCARTKSGLAVPVEYVQTGLFELPKHIIMRPI